MAATPLSGRPLPFKIPAGLDAIKARDAKFWQLHGAWRTAVDAFEAWPGYPDECERSALLLDRSDVAFTAMLGCGVRTAIALNAKYLAMQEMGTDLDRQIHPSYTLGELLAWDLERLVKFEVLGPDAFQDMSEG